jgi:transposase
MQTVTTIGLDIAKSVFQVHGVDAAGQVVIRRKLKRRYVTKCRACMSCRTGYSIAQLPVE